MTTATVKDEAMSATCDPAADGCRALRVGLLKERDDREVADREERIEREGAFKTVSEKLDRLQWWIMVQAAAVSAGLLTGLLMFLLKK